ncbi:MAG TPA: GDSL-type esterase/lipase family protein [Parafilimonas sp.]|nr:GDSL-type esterase/lipase family protein [Parafilimonas sp.]
MKKIAFLISVCISVITLKVFSQPPFYDEIRAFKIEDSLHKPAQHAILFVGSSSFRKWTDVQSYFPGYTIINRGFGGSSLPDVIRYANDIIFPYNPKEIVIYCGENDFAGDESIGAETVFDRFKTLYGMIRKKLPAIPVVYISIKPSPSRRQYWTKMIAANKMIKDYISKQPHTSFVDVFDLMLNDHNQPKPEIFLGDSLHMNANGYKIWQKAIQPYLVK